MHTDIHAGGEIVFSEDVARWQQKVNIFSLNLKLVSCVIMDFPIRILSWALIFILKSK